MTDSDRSVVSVLFTLPLTHPILLDLVISQKPFSRPSILPQSQANKFLGRISSSVTARDVTVEERQSALKLAKEIVLQDEEGWAMSGWGKGWMTSAMAAVTATNSILSAIPPYLQLIEALVVSSSQFPAFERESVHPIAGKLSTNLSKLLERATSDQTREWSILLDLLRSTSAILQHFPTNFRQLTAPIRALIVPLMTEGSHQVPKQVRAVAIDLFASLHLTAGKAQIPQGWAADMRGALLGLRQAFEAASVDGWLQNLAASAKYPSDPASRLPIAFDHLEGWCEVIIAFLRRTSSRAVPVPIGQITQVALRCLDLTQDTPVVEYISPQHHAALIGSLPRLWTVGVLLIGNLASSCGDHLLPHLSEIFDHTTYLAENVPITMVQVQTQIFRLHRLILSIYPAALLPVDYTSRLLKHDLSTLSAVLETIDGKPSISQADAATANGAKKGKKRARGEEDSLVGGLEGRERRKIGDEALLAIEGLNLTSLLHAAPLLPAPLLTLSIRLHLSLFLALPDMPRSAFSHPQSQARLIDSLRKVLEASCTSIPDNGQARGWTNVIVAVLRDGTPSLNNLINPSVPPVLRPAPPLAALHFFKAESEEEKKVRRSLGLRIIADEDESEDGLAEHRATIGTQAVVVPVAANDVRAGTNDIAKAPQMEQVIVAAPLPAHAPPKVSSPATQGPKPIILSETSDIRGSATELAISVDGTVPENNGDQEMEDGAESAVLDFIEVTAVSGSSNSAAANEPHPVAGSGTSGQLNGDDDDEGIPDLDSEMSDLDDDAEDEDEDE